MAHLDVKKVGVIPGGGWRVHGRGTEQAKQSIRGRKRGGRARYTYLHTAIDGIARLAYTEALPDETARTAIAVTHRASAFFARHGIRHIHRIVTDDDACHRARDFATVLRGARHQRITPYEQHRSEALEIWNVHYNYHRPHTTAGNQPPATRLHTRVTNVTASYTWTTDPLSRSAQPMWSFRWLRGVADRHRGRVRRQRHTGEPEVDRSGNVVATGDLAWSGGAVGGQAATSARTAPRTTRKD